MLVARGFLHSQTAATASVTGTVTDPSGTAIAGAHVCVRNVDTAVARTGATDLSGMYALLSLAPGLYQVTAQAPGFTTAVVPSIRLSVGQDARADFQLLIGVRQETVTVSERVPPLAGNPTGTSQVLDRSEMEALPLVLRNYVQLTLLTPKVLPASSTSARGYMGDRYKDNQFSFQGVRQQYNYQTIDGVPATVFMTNTLKSFYSLESVQEFRVTNGLFTPEQGHAMGGVVNVVTRSGSNDWHGGVYDYFRNNALNQPDLLATHGPRVFRMNQFGAFGGGPLRKEKIFIYGNYEGQRRAQSPSLPAVFVENLPAINLALGRLGFPPENINVLQTEDSDQFLVRADYIPGARHRFMVRHNFYNTNSLNDRIGAHGQLDDPIAPSGGRNLHLRDEGLAVSLYSFPSSDWVNVAGFGFEKHHYRFTPLPGVPFIQVVVRGVFSSGVDTAEQAARERKFHVQDAVTWMHGRHELKFGAEYIRADASQANGSLNQALLPGLEGLLAPQPIVHQTGIAQGALPPGHIFHADQTGAFLQDRWKATSQITFDFGLRYDLEMPGGLTTLVDSGRGNLQPRIGFAWSPARQTPLVIRGGFGIYTGDRYHALMASDALVHGLGFPGFNEAFLQANPFARKYHPLQDTFSIMVYRGDAAYPALFQFASTGKPPATVAPAGPAVSVQNPTLPNPYAEQWGLDIEYRIGPSLTLSVGYSGLRGLRLPVSINRNLRPATASLPNGKSDYQVVGANAASRLYDPRYAYAYIIDPIGSSFYNGATLTVRKVFARHHSFGANFVFSRNIDDFGARSITTAPEDSYNVRGDRSVSSEHAKHRLNFWLITEAPQHVPVLGGFTASLIATAQSPRYYNVTAGIDLNNDLNVNPDRPDVLGRNTFRGDDFFSIDLRVSRRVRIKERLSLDVVADMLNLLNRVNVTDLDTVCGHATLALPPASAFNTPRAAGNAFQIQLGLRLAF